MGKGKPPALELLRRPRAQKCWTCRYEEGAVSDWIHALLEEWVRNGRDRPALDDLFFTLKEKFPGFGDVVRNSSTLRNHLLRHEPLWERPGWR